MTADAHWSLVLPTEEDWRYSGGAQQMFVDQSTRDIWETLHHTGISTLTTYYSYSTGSGVR